jgi:hypothetical protein
MESSHQDTGAEMLALSHAEAFAGVIFAANSVAQELSEKTFAYFRDIFSRMRLFEGWSATHYHTLFEKLTDMLKTQGLETLLEMSIRALPPKLYQTAFAVAVDIVLADGLVNKEEKDFLYMLQKKLQIETELATKIIEVIVIKNRG